MPWRCGAEKRWAAPPSPLPGYVPLIYISVADPDPPDPHVLGLLDSDPDPSVRGLDPDPDPDLDLDHSITKQKKVRKTLIPTAL